VKGGTEYSLYFEYQLGYNRENGASIRKKETLSLYLKANPRTPVERQQNKETLALAKKIQFERSQELLGNKEGYRLKKKDAINLLDYFEQFAKTANVADRLALVGALNNFKDFLGKKYPQYANWIEARNLSSDMMQKFVDYLVENHKGQGAETYYKRFKRMINYAVENEVIAKSPCKGITTPKTTFWQRTFSVSRSCRSCLLPIMPERILLLGHSSLRFTEIYVCAVDEEKKKAINSMPKLDIL